MGVAVWQVNRRLIVSARDVRGSSAVAVACANRQGGECAVKLVSLVIFGAEGVVAGGVWGCLQ